MKIDPEKQDWAYLPGLTQTIKAEYVYMRDGTVVQIFPLLEYKPQRMPDASV